MRRILAIVIVAFMFTFLFGCEVKISTRKNGDENGISNQIPGDTSFSLDDIIDELKNQKNVSLYRKSPNNEYIAYMVGKSSPDSFEPSSLYIWKVDTKEPILTDILDETDVCDLWWSPNSRYLFIDTGTFVSRSGYLLDVKEMKTIDSIGYIGEVYYSPDSKKILYSASSGITSKIKEQFIDLCEIQDLLIYDIDSGKEKSLLNGTDSIDYSAHGWLDEQTVSYTQNEWNIYNGELSYNETSYTYDLLSEKSFLIAKDDQGYAAKFNPIVAGDYLLGGYSHDNGWITAEDLADSIKGGEVYNCYAFDKMAGKGTGSSVELIEPCDTVSVTVSCENDYLVAVSGEWNALPRVPISQGTDNEIYKKVIKDFLAENGLADTEAVIRQNYRIDIDGDGVDEVLIWASNMDFDYIDIMGKKGQYSIILLRRLVDGEVKNIPVTCEIYTEDYSEDYNDDFYTSPDFTLALAYIDKIRAIADVNGDGKMEVIVDSRYYEGHFVVVYELQNDKLVLVISNGWGV